MYYKPMTYMYHTYLADGEPTRYVVFYCTKDGKRLVQKYERAKQARAFVDALKGIGYRKHKNY